MSTNFCLKNVRFCADLLKKCAEMLRNAKKNVNFWNHPKITLTPFSKTSYRNFCRKSHITRCLIVSCRVVYLTGTIPLLIRLRLNLANYPVFAVFNQFHPYYFAFLQIPSCFFEEDHKISFASAFTLSVAIFH